MLLEDSLFMSEVGLPVHNYKFEYTSYIGGGYLLCYVHMHSYMYMHQVKGIDACHSSSCACAKCFACEL